MTLACVLWLPIALSSTTPGMSLELVPDAARPGYVEIRGVTAGAFDPALWQASTRNLLPDVRSPFLEPRPGKFRNIYAPSAVPTPNGWRLFYGAWDGVPTGNDRIYGMDTSNFIKGGPRATVIEHGVFIHACNVNAVRSDDGFYEMVCTVYPDQRDRNKPAYFTSPDGKTWNGTPMPHPAGYEDIVEITGYAAYDDADINGMNVLLRDGAALRLYFANFKDFGHVYRATQTRGKTFRFDGEVLPEPYAPNDVKKFNHEGTDCYLMGLHMNREGLWYSLSNDGMTFAPTQTLLEHLGDEDRYIVALGWVVRDNALLGVLYGAGPVPALNENRIFARWLQRRAVFVAEDGTRYAPERSYGPNRQLIPLPLDKVFKGHIEVFAEDGVTPIGAPVPAAVGAGQVWNLRIP